MWRARIGTTSSLLLAISTLMTLIICTGAASGGTPGAPLPWAHGAPKGTIPAEALQALLDQTVARGIPGVVVGIGTPEGSWYGSSGVANVESGEPMSPFHVLRLANDTEIFTAALIWSLIEEGRLSLTDKVNRRLPSGLVPRGDEITIGMLLNHTSGLYDHTESDEYGKVMAKSPDHAWKAGEVLAITRAHPFRFNSGTGYAYCSTEAYILGLIAEAATGRTVENLVRKRFFTPLNMARSSFSPPGRLPALSTPGYVWLDGQGQPVSTGQWSFSGQWAAGSAASNANEMLVWAWGLISGKVLKPKTLQRALTVSAPSMTGYGFDVTRNPSGGRRVGRMGVKPGTTTDFVIYPDETRALFIGLNISDARLAPTLSTRRIIRDVREGVERLLGWSVETDYSETIAYGRAAMEDVRTRFNIASASVALIDGERIVWSETFGTIDKTSKTPPGPDTMFCIGSVSKIFAAMATMKLLDQGKVDLDAPLVQYLPDFRMASPLYSQITVRMLLNHSAGLGGCDFRNMFSYAALPGYSEQVEEALATLRLKHAPGYMSVYCNDCVTMIEPLVESASGGKPYVQFVQENVLTPLGMENSRFTLEPFSPGTFAPAFMGDVPDPQEFAQPHASGGLYTTPEDMARVAMMLMNGGVYGGSRILSAQAIAEMGADQTRRLPFNPVPTYARGLGWDNVAHSGLAAVGVRAWHKKGGTMVYETDFVVAPEERLAIMVTFSGRSMSAGLPAEQIMLRALVERGSIPEMPRRMPDGKQPEKPATEASLAAMVGDYANKNGPIRVELQPGKQGVLQISSEYDFEAQSWLQVEKGLKRRVDGTFSSDDQPNVSYRTLVADGRHYLVKSEPKWSGHYREESPYAQRLRPAAPLSEAWKNRVGGTWLTVNEDASSFLLARGVPPCFTLGAMEGLPGYLFASFPYLQAQVVDPSGSDSLARMFLKIPMELGRDLNDVLMEVRDGEEWVRYGSLLFRPRAGVPVLPVGSGTLAIGTEGFAQWRQLASPCSVAISGARAWNLYDGDLALKQSGTGSGTITVESAGSYLMLFGDPDTSISWTNSEE